MTNYNGTWILNWNFSHSMQRLSSSSPSSVFLSASSPAKNINSFINKQVKASSSAKNMNQQVKASSPTKKTRPVIARFRHWGHKKVNETRQVSNRFRHWGETNKSRFKLVYKPYISSQIFTLDLNHVKSYWIYPIEKSRALHNIKTLRLLRIHIW